MVLKLPETFFAEMNLLFGKYQPTFDKFIRYQKKENKEDDTNKNNGIILTSGNQKTESKKIK